MTIRPAVEKDIPALCSVLEGTKLFPAELLPEMFAGSDPVEVWLGCEVEGVAVGFCYAVPEEMTEGAWNILALAVLPACQGQGHGARIVAGLEVALRKRAARIVLADTSSAQEFHRTRAFYLKSGYTQEARTRDFWAECDDKITFWKALG